MKTDQYLSLCLEQANKSPLHYRHGCIIVRGGKVIGQGHNDYRPGFNGGALKHGRIAKGAFDGAAVSELKEKLKKQKEKFKLEEKQQSNTVKPFIPFEGTGGGNHANTPLSMHSEMMAIHSALSASSTLTSIAASYEKPCFKLPRSDKRKARLRREVLAAYVNAVCQTSQRSGLSQYQPQGNNKDKEEENCNEEDEERDLPAAPMWNEKSLAFHQAQGGKKHHHHHQNLKKNEKNGQKNEYQYQYGRYGSQIQQQHGQHLQFAPKHGSSNTIRGLNSTNANDTSDLATRTAVSAEDGTFRKPNNRCGKTKKPLAKGCSQPEPLLLPTGHAEDANNRKKHSRLNGADLYVARVGWCGNSAIKPKRASQITNNITTITTSTTTETTDSYDGNDSLSTSISSISESTTSSSGSLHDELINPHPSPGPSSASTVSTSSNLDASTVRASRPCYRCISYMHSVGIKRVFWTNDAGEWEGGKVRDLVDALDNSMDSLAGGKVEGGPTGNGVFVTKHEVLMLKRKMGNNGT